jgi:hypothetical protein
MEARILLTSLLSSYLLESGNKSKPCLYIERTRLQDGDALEACQVILEEVVVVLDSSG